MRPLLFVRRCVCEQDNSRTCSHMVGVSKGWPSPVE